MKISSRQTSLRVSHKKIKHGPSLLKTQPKSPEYANRSLYKAFDCKTLVTEKADNKKTSRHLIT